VYVEGTLYSSISLLEIDRDINYAYSSRVGGKLCLHIGVKTLPLLSSRHKNTPIHTPWDLHRFSS